MISHRKKGHSMCYAPLQLSTRDADYTASRYLSNSHSDTRIRYSFPFLAAGYQMPWPVVIAQRTSKQPVSFKLIERLSKRTGQHSILVSKKTQNRPTEKQAGFVVRDCLC